MRFRLFIFLIIIPLAISCNWNMYSATPEDKPSSDSVSSNITIAFSGEAPKNVYASQSIYSGYVVVSFDAVSGADSYDIERIVVDKNSAEAEMSSAVWKIIHTVSDTGSSRYTYRDNTANDGSKVYIYRIKANSLFAAISNGIVGEYSDIASGWPLSPPVSLSATQGTYTDRIILEWSRMDLTKGYNLYYYVPNEGTAEIWNKINTNIIPSPYGTDTISYTFYPTSDAYGKDIYFKVRSLSRSSVESEDSGYRTGYTFKIGAPQIPEDLTAGDAYSSIYIPISWKQPASEGAVGSYYRWEIMRSTPTSDELTIKTFNSDSIPDDITLENGFYTYKDQMSSGEIKPGVVYTYTVRAVLVETENGEITESIGVAASDDGCLINPAITLGDSSTTYPSSANSGSFSFTIAAPPAEFTEASGWFYAIYGRNNVLDKEIGEWKFIERVPVTFDPVIISVDYDSSDPVNEFDVRIIDKEGNESVGYAEYMSTPIVTELAAAPSVSLLSVTQNKYSQELSPNSNGVYPVVVTIGNDSKFVEYQVEAVSPSGKSMGTVNMGNDQTKVLDSLSPSVPGEIWQYRIRGTDVFNRYSAWSEGAEGYGALTGNAFIKFFEAYAMKPWEFVNDPDFPANLKTKWNKSKIHSLIDQHGLGSLGEETEYSDYHDGSIYYHSYASGFAGDVDFVYKNFGELECIYSNGSYKMDNVNASGNNGKCSGTMTVGGMYPAAIDFSSLGVTDYAFSGNYILSQENGRGTENVEAVRNE